MYTGYYPAIMRLPDLSEWSFNTLLGLGDREHNRKARQMREEARPARKSEPIQLWGVWNKYKNNKNPKPDNGEDGVYRDETEVYRARGDSETMRLTPRNAPYPPEDRGQRRLSVTRGAGASETVRSGKQMDDMFNSFKTTSALSQKEKERIDRL